MGRQTKSRKPECVGKGKVTPVQIAFIVDRYLSDNNFAQSRSIFRSEASHLISKSHVQEAPKSLLSLGAILDEYITLKEQKVGMDQERCRLEQEKLRVQKLLRGMQDAMSAYNACGNYGFTPSPLLPVAVSQTDSVAVTPAGYYPKYISPAIMSASRPSSIRTDSTNYCTPVTSHATVKRKGSTNVSDGPMTSKKSRRSILPKDVDLVTKTTNEEKSQEKCSAARSYALETTPNGSSVQGSNVVKCLFNQKLPSASTNSSVPRTPTRASSSQMEKSVSPVEICSMATSSKDVTPGQHMMSTNCTIFSSETIRVSPTKQIGYYSIEKNRCVSTCSPVKTHLKRSNVKDHVKGRLDFGASDVPTTMTENQTSDGTSTSESEKEGDILDLDFFGWDFNLSELLDDFDIDGEGLLGLSSQQGFHSSPDSNSGSPTTSGNIMHTEQNTSQFPSTMAGVLGDKDMNLVGPDSVAAMHSVTKCIIYSPVKSQRSSFDQENLPATN